VIDTTTAKFAAAYRAGREAYRKDLGVLPFTGLVIFGINLFSHHVGSAIIALLVFGVLGPPMRQFFRKRF
jgi:hypothetical protein